MKIINFAFLVIFLSSCASRSKDPAAPDTKAMKSYYALALQGNLKAAAKPFETKKNLSLAEMELMVNYRDRFVKKIKPQLNVENPFVEDVIEAYQDYWNEVLTKELTEREGFYLLFKNLNKVLDPLAKKIQVYDDQRLKEIADSTKDEIEKRGYFGLYGMTRPHLELMIWKKQKNKTYKVKLHDGVQKVEVVMMDDFKSLGWAAYATFGKSFTGGWATKEKLFCVKPAYNLKSEKYKVSYLKHEARHFADYKVFPKLKQPELEYRAKLTELIYADKTLYDLIEKFKTNGENSRVSPHAYANYHVYHNLKKIMSKASGPIDLFRVPKKKINEAALTLLLESNTHKKTQFLD